MDENTKLCDLTVGQYRSLFFPDRSSSFRAPEPVVKPPAPVVPKQGVDYTVPGSLIMHAEEEWEDILGYKISAVQVKTWWINEPDRRIPILK